MEKSKLFVYVNEMWMGKVVNIQRLGLSKIVLSLFYQPKEKQIDTDATAAQADGLKIAWK